MRQRAFSRPVPIKTNLPMKEAGFREEDDDTVLPLPLTPLTPRTEFDLRMACKALVNFPTPISTISSVPPTTSYKQAPRINAPVSASFATKTFTSPTCSDEEAKKATLLALTSKPHPAPPPLDPLSPIQYEFATTATARKFSVTNLRASDATLKTTRTSPSGAMASPALCWKPTVVDVSNRPRTADMRPSRITKNLETFNEDRETLALFPRPGTSHQPSQRPSTSHYRPSVHRPSTSGGSKAPTIELNDRPLPPLPVNFIKPVQRSKSDSEVVLKKATLGSFGRKIATFFGRGKKQEAAPAA